MISHADILSLANKQALTAFVEDRFNGDFGELIAALSTDLNALLRTDLGKAASFLESIKSLRRFIPKTLKPHLDAFEARYLHWSGQSKKATNIYERAIKAMISQREFAAAARTRQGLLDAYMYVGNYVKALAVGRKALTYFRRKNDRNNAARVMTNIGNIYHRLDKNRLALGYYDKAREVFAAGGGMPLAIVDFNRANIYTNLNKLDKAEKLYISVAKTCREHGLTISAVKAEYSLAYLYFLQDRYTEALNTFEHVYEDFQNLGDKRGSAVTRLDLTEINLQLNQYGSAVMIGLETITALRASGMRYEQAKAAFFVGEALTRLGDLNQAGEYLGLAERLFKKENNDLWQGMVSLAKSRLSSEHGQYSRAANIAAIARQMFSRSGDKRREMDADIALMETTLKAGKIIPAQRIGHRLLKRDLASYQKHAVNSMMSESYLRENKHKEALAYVQRAIAAAESMLERIQTDEIRFMFALNKYQTYVLAVQCLLQLGRVNESFLSHSRALAVLNQRRIPLSALKRQVPEELLQVRAGLRASLKKLDRIGESGQRGMPGSTVFSRIEHDLWANERRIRAHVADAHPVGEKQRGPIENPSGNLRSNEVLVNYLTLGTKVGAFITISGRTRFLDCPISTDEIEAAVRELHFLLEKNVYSPLESADFTKIIDYYLGDLYSRLVAPLAIDSRLDHLILLIDGIFTQIPFMALKTPDGDYLKDRYRIDILVNPEDLARRENGSGISGNSRSAVFAPDNAGLPLIQEEGRSIKQAFPRVRYFESADATTIALKEELERVDGFVHIASHASRSSENPLFSRILLHDGPFFPFDLYETGINASLISLSGCQTAAPGIYYGNAFSLAKAFYQGGVRYVLASLWSVSDKVSLVFMAEFYKALRRSYNVSDAYRSAVARTAGIFNNPAFWSSFILIGI